MTEIIYANGDSFTYGVGLEDQAHAYPFLLAKHRRCQLVNDAYPGSSHDRILRLTMKFVGNNLDKDLFVVIGWGFSRRMEFYYDTNVEAEEDEANYIRYSSDPLNERTKHRYPNDDCREFIRLYHENFTNRNAAATRAMTRVIALQSFLDSMDVPYLFFNSAWTIPTTDESLTNMINERRYYGFQDPNMTFDKWTWNSGSRGRSTLGHPDQHGHSVWFTNLRHYIDTRDLWNMH